MWRDFLESKKLEEKYHLAHPWLAMLPLLLGAFIGMLSETSLNIALPQLMKAFNVPTGTIQWMVTGYMLVIGIILPLSSFLTKWFTTRQLVIFGLATFLIGSIISATAGSFGILLTGRMIQGIGTGVVLPLMFTIAMQIFPPYKLGQAMGACAMVIMLAPAIGPTVTGIILGALSWNWIFWLFVPVLAIGLIFAFTSLKNVGEITKTKVDWLSIIESAVGFALIVSGVSLIADLGFSALTISLLVIGIIIIALYVHRQLNLKNPILNLRIFGIKQFSLGAVLVMLDFGVILSSMYLMPQYIQSGRLLAAALTGIIMLPGGLINAITSAFAGRIYDSIGARKPALIGFGIAFIGAGMFLFISTSSPIWYIILAHVILMIGCPLAMSPSQTYALNAVQGVAAADGSTIMNTLQQIVGAISTAVATILLSFGQRIMPNASAAEKFTNGTHFGFYFTLALIVISFILSFNIKNED